jgi:hypothetical protein
MTMIARLSLITLSLVVAATLASGCYTVLRHPGSQMLLSDDSDDHGSRRACADCHQDSRFYHDAFDPSYYGFGAYAVDPLWSDYYYRPWWYEDYWYYPAPPASQTVQTSTTPHVWGEQPRRDLTPFPIIGGGTSGGGASSSGSSGGTPTNPEPDAEPSKPSGRSEDSKDEEPHRAPERREMTPNPPPPPPN